MKIVYTHLAYISLLEEERELKIALKHQTDINEPKQSTVDALIAYSSALKICNSENVGEIEVFLN